MSVTLVLGGGGLKGLAHVGVFRALAERGLVPGLCIGTSVGALIGAAWAAGRTPDEMAAYARGVRRKHIFRVAHTDMALRRMFAPAVYRPEPLDGLIRDLVGDRTYRDLDRPLFVNSVDLNSGQQVLWGPPGLEGVRVADTVFASCALPGIFPPRRIDDRWFVDGAVVDNLPVRAAALATPHPIIAVNLSGGAHPATDVQEQGFAATYVRGLELVMFAQVAGALRAWDGPPLLLIEPRVEQISMFAFDRTEELLQEGYRATLHALDSLGAPLDRLRGAVYRPRRAEADARGG